MTPAARAAAAIEILDEWERGADRAEPLLRGWGRANRFAGSKDRRAIADIVYDCLRRRRSFAALSGAEGARRLLHGRALAEGEDPAAVFSGEGHAPPPLSDEERRAPGEMTEAERLDCPDWLFDTLSQSLGARFAPVMAALQARAPVDLRANTLKTTREALIAELRDAGLEAEALATPGALRCPPGARLAQLPALLEGRAELQDEASQAGAAFPAPQPGETVLDYCAGGGGKALAFAALMEGEGRVLAHDIEPRRMRDLPRRAERAGANIELVKTAELGALKAACDLVFVDAPCSGSGSWRRDPEGKWRLTPEMLTERLTAQREAFAAALSYMKPDGRIAYATCSFFEAENREQTEGFAREYGLVSEARLIRLPDEGADGFFCEVLRRG